ncbi:MAG: DNA gyrase subunit A [Kouleothrix sp.]
MILGAEGITNTYSTRRGHITLRAKAHIEEAARSAYNIVVTELPYQVNKARLPKLRIAEVAKSARSRACATCATSPIRGGMRLVIILKQDAQRRRSPARCISTPRCRRHSASICWRWSVGYGRAVLTLKLMLQEHIEHRRR